MREGEKGWLGKLSEFFQTSEGKLAVLAVGLLVLGWWYVAKGAGVAAA